jgi:hypothetical protein
VPRCGAAAAAESHNRTIGELHESLTIWLTERAPDKIADLLWKNINCRDCDVRSLVEPEPDRHVFAKFKHLLRKAAARSAETICVTIGEILEHLRVCGACQRWSACGSSCS